MLFEWLARADAGQIATMLLSNIAAFTTMDARKIRTYFLEQQYQSLSHHVQGETIKLLPKMHYRC